MDFWRSVDRTNGTLFNVQFMKYISKIDSNSYKLMLSQASFFFNESYKMSVSLILVLS